jgi:protease IV
MNFFKTFLASFLALMAFLIIGLVLFIVVIGALTADEKVVVSKNSVLHLRLDAEITEQQVDNPFEGMPVFGGGVANIGLLKLKDAIRYAKTDPNIEGIFLNVSFPITGFAALEEIRQSLIDFRLTGKWVVAYADVMSERAYYLASAADKVYLNPEGEVEFNGLTITISFYKRLFEKLDIKPEIFRVGDFKSGVEPFVLEKMSAENRLQLTELVNSIYTQVLTGIAETRNIPAQKLREISDNMLASDAALAVQHGLVDALMYYDEVQDELRERLGVKADAKIKLIRLSRYTKAITQKKQPADEIAVIIADGTIMPGPNKEGIVGDQTITEEIRKARKNKKIKAIVMRINSPGGSFQASDVMWREVSLAAQEKPVVASMSNLAASGGYYLAMACDTIVAQPHTITGSIGVYSVLFDASGFLNNKIGITFDEINTGEYGDMVTLTRPLTAAEKNVWQRRTDDIYETFTRKAAEGRGMEVDDIKKVASGRVWTGEQAITRGLVDVLGGYDDAITLAASMAGLDEYSVKLYPREKPFFEQLMSQLTDNARTRSLKQELGEYYSVYQQWQTLKMLHGTQARMPFEWQLQ